MQTKLTIIATVAVVLLIGGVLVFSGGGGEAGTPAGRPTSATGEATIVDGVQYVDITARGGYTPRITKAQAGIPTVIRMKTEDTFDCSMALAIPDLGYQSFLKQSAVEEISVPVEKAQGTLRGLCSMAMYHFQIDFE